MKELDLRISERRFKVILRSLKDRERLLNELCAVSTDEDEVALAGNDLIELRMFLREFEALGVQTFGESALNISDELL
ncbi:MAG TPA: hypothetical protein VF950_25485 [Planctomycetota bacterium]